MKNNYNLIGNVNSKIDKVLRPHIPSPGRIALLDFPDYANVGDSAIWCGITKYFRDFHHIKPAYVSAQANFNAKEMRDAIGNDGVIFICGGGNFGDLWPEHQKFRERVIKLFPTHKIIQLPQSIHFKSSKTLKRSAAIINAHPNFTLLVRDNESLKIAADNFNCKVELCPDMAYCLGALSKPVKPFYPLVMLMRTDKERVALTQVDSNAYIVDWLEDDSDMHPSTLERILGRIFSVLPFAPSKIERRLSNYQHLANSRLNRGLRLLSLGEKITTDRLHAYILAMLLDIPCETMDNSYGKLGNFIDAWISTGAITLESEIGIIAAI